MNSDQRIAYVRAVWFEFQKKARTRREMSNTEWCLARKWATETPERPPVPLRVVLRALQDFSGEPRRLEAFEVPVEKAYEYWVKTLGGA